MGSLEATVPPWSAAPTPAATRLARKFLAHAEITLKHRFAADPALMRAPFTSSTTGEAYTYCSPLEFEAMARPRDLIPLVMACCPDLGLRVQRQLATYQVAKSDLERAFLAAHLSHALHVEHDL